MLFVFVEKFCAFWAQTQLSRKILWIFLCLPVFVFLLLFVLHVTDNDKSRVLTQDVDFNLV